MFEFVARMLAHPSSEVAYSPEGPATPAAVLVHCEKGISRSAAAVIAYLMEAWEKQDPEEVLENGFLRRKAKPNRHFMEQPRVWGAVGYTLFEADGEILKKEYAEWIETWKEALEAKGLTGDEQFYEDLD